MEREAFCPPQGKWLKQKNCQKHIILESIQKLANGAISYCKTQT
jgi:hypothetical protein